ncbi:MAG: carbon-nitrogen hydrolase family protein, partial [Shimia sp.]|nr:carbon-nitrogen hydrolase family protein [Shimia sp.]
MKIALLQITSSDDPTANLLMLESMIREAAASGAEFVFTPEVTNCLSTSRTHQEAVLSHEDADPMLSRVQELCSELGIWVNLGSLAIKTTDQDGRFANRSFVIDATGDVVARYDKIHMFDVDVS